MIRLDPPIPLDVVSGWRVEGTALAYFLIDYSTEHNMLWVVAMDETGECWTVPNRYIRFAKNYSLERRLTKTS